MSLIPQAYDPEWTDLSGGVFNDGAGGSFPDAGGQPVPTPAPPPGPPPTAIVPPPSPTGPSPWSNPNSCYGFPINTSGLVLAKNPGRTLIVLQNNSTGPTSADVGAVMYYSFGRPAVIGQSLSLAAGVLGNPGIALILDFICPRDALYVAFGPVVGAGTAVGAVMEGAHAPEQAPAQLPEGVSYSNAGYGS